MPYADYRAALEAFARNQRSYEGGTVPTVEETIASIEETIALARADTERLQAVVPEDCYRAAHDEMIAYRTTAIAPFEDTLPILADAEAAMGMVPFILAMDAELRTRHPDAYVEDPDNMTGFRSEPLNILGTLATCEPSVGEAVAEPPAPVPVAQVEGMVFSD